MVSPDRGPDRQIALTRPPPKPVAVAALNAYNRHTRQPGTP
jgi:hypothetical protein